MRLSERATFGVGVIIATLGTILVVGFLPGGLLGGAAVVGTALWLVPVGALINLDSAIIRAGGRVVGAYAPSLVIRPLAILVSAATVWFVAGHLTPFAAIAVTLCVYTAIVLLQLLLVKGLYELASCLLSPLTSRVSGYGFRCHCSLSLAFKLR